MTQSSATTPGQGEPGSNGNKGVLHIPQSSSITRFSPSYCLVSNKHTHWRSPTLYITREGTSKCIIMQEKNCKQHKGTYLNLFENYLRHLRKALAGK